jgi:hypothetical protein
MSCLVLYIEPGFVVLIKRWSFLFCLYVHEFLLSLLDLLGGVRSVIRVYWLSHIPVCI